MVLEGNFDITILDYNISHNMCLLRIFDYPLKSKNTDIIFSGTVYIGIPTKMNGKVSIEQIAQKEFLNDSIGKLINEPQMKIFRFSYQESEFYIIARLININETTLLPLQSSIK